MHRGTPESLQDVPVADRASARVRIMRYVHWSPLGCVHSGVKCAVDSLPIFLYVLVSQAHLKSKGHRKRKVRPSNKPDLT